MNMDITAPKPRTEQYIRCESMRTAILLQPPQRNRCLSPSMFTPHRQLGNCGSGGDKFGPHSRGALQGGNSTPCVAWMLWRPLYMQYNAMQCNVSDKTRRGLHLKAAQWAIDDQLRELLESACRWALEAGSGRNPASEVSSLALGDRSSTAGPSSARRRAAAWTRGP